MACLPFVFDEPDLLKATPRHELHNIVTTTFSADGSANVDVVTYDDIVLSFPTTDVYTGTTTVNANHSFYSIYDYDLQKAGKAPVWSLPESALAAQAALLVPRAVGYSAGFLEHFFRGQVDVAWDRNADNTYAVTLTNLSHE